MITRTFTPHPDLLALPIDERLEWVGYLETRRQTRNELKKCSGFCCLGALIDGRGYDWSSGHVGLGYESLLMNFGERSAFHISAATVDNHEDLTITNELRFYVLNDIYKLTFPEISELLKGNVVVKEYDE